MSLHVGLDERPLREFGAALCSSSPMGSRFPPLPAHRDATPWPATPTSLVAAATDESSDVTRCDACEEPIAVSDDDDGFSMGGAGVYVWTRGDEVRKETVPLCPSCAAAIGVSALARWESEEEEG